MMTLAAIIAQYVLGVLTLLWAVPLALGVAHQVTALVIVVVWVSWLHHVWHIDVAPVQTPMHVRSAP